MSNKLKNKPRNEPLITPDPVHVNRLLGQDLPREVDMELPITRVAVEIGVEPETSTRTERPKRIPLGTRNVLTAPARRGFVRRFVNDVEDRVQRFRDAGYSVVKGHVQVGDPKAGDDTPMGSVVGKSVGQGTKAVLMEIPEDWYNEDQKDRQDAITQQEQGMSRSIGKTPVDETGQYGEVKIQHGT